MGSYLQDFLKPGVLQPFVVTTRFFTIMGFYRQRSYERMSVNIDERPTKLKNRKFSKKFTK